MYYVYSHSFVLFARIYRQKAAKNKKLDADSRNEKEKEENSQAAIPKK